MLRVLVVEDSPIITELLVDLFEQDKDIQVIARTESGAAGIAAALRDKPDLISLDLGLPDMTGFEVISAVLAHHHVPILVITATLRPADRQEAFHALTLGAVHVMEKPEGTALWDPTWRHWFRQQARTLAGVPPAPDASSVSSIGHSGLLPATGVPHTGPPEVMTVVASAGGPLAVRQLLAELPPVNVPVVTAFHIGSTLDDTLARYLGEVAHMPVQAAVAGERLKPGHIYVAPGGQQVAFSRRGRLHFFRETPFETPYAPCFDIFLESVARIYGGRTVSLIMSGMGSDGAEGMLRLRQAGAFTAGQDEASCLVYGMPRVAMELEAVSVQGPPACLASAAADWLRVCHAGVE